jgi:predicted ATP-binding protein involved in virulence
MRRCHERKLASGHKNIIAMIGDMLIRFYAKQPEVIEPQYFCGIVLIDELDLHLHPKWQRQLPKLLSNVFPNVQFIASTHSVIPFLGAPENSVFLKVNRSQEQGITVERINIDISNLLPNSLLTSPLFDLEGKDIKSENNRRLSDVRTVS